VVGVSVVRRPAPASAALAVVPGLVAVAALSVTPTTLVLALAGLLVAGTGTLRGSRRGVTVGSGLLFVGLLAGGVGGMDPALQLLAAAGAIVTWTTAQHVVGLGAQLGRDAPVRRSVLVHLAGASVATLVPGGIALALFRSTAGATSVEALLLLLGGSVVLLYVLEP
jgi:hypothetical protein